MKYIISERQFSLIKEQVSDSRFGLERFGYNPNKPETLDNAMKQDKEFRQSLDPHTVLSITAIASSFIPLVGPLIALGIGLADASIYLQKGDKKTAGLVALFASIPAIGQLANRLGLSAWSAKQLAELGKKISTGGKLTSNEIQVVNKIIQNKEIIKSEIVKLGNSPNGKNILKGIGKFSATLGGYAGLGYLYDKVTDRKIDVKSVNIKDVSDVNKKAATEIKFD